MMMNVDKASTSATPTRFALTQWVTTPVNAMRDLLKTVKMAVQVSFSWLKIAFIFNICGNSVTGRVLITFLQFLMHSNYFAFKFL